MELNKARNARLDRVFAALADGTRRAILARLASGEASVNELAEPFRLAQPTISKHLKVLEAAGLIERGQDAQRRPRRLVAPAFMEVAGWLQPFAQQWDARFQRLDQHLARRRKKEQ